MIDETTSASYPLWIVLFFQLERSFEESFRKLVCRCTFFSPSRTLLADPNEIEYDEQTSNTSISGRENNNSRFTFLTAFLQQWCEESVDQGWTSSFDCSNLRTEKWFADVQIIEWIEVLHWQISRSNSSPWLRFDWDINEREDISMRYKWSAMTSIYWKSCSGWLMESERK